MGKQLNARCAGCNAEMLPVFKAFAAAKERIEVLETALRSALGALEGLEYAQSDNWGLCQCAECQGDEPCPGSVDQCLLPQGHRDGCRLDAIIKAVRRALP